MQGGLQLIKTFTNEEKENCKTTKGLFTVLSQKIKPCHNRIVLFLQYHKLKRKSHESAQLWMGKLQTRATDCDNKQEAMWLMAQLKEYLSAVL